MGKVKFLITMSNISKYMVACTAHNTHCVVRKCVRIKIRYDRENQEITSTKAVKIAYFGIYPDALDMLNDVWSSQNEFSFL